MVPALLAARDRQFLHAGIQASSGDHLPLAIQAIPTCCADPEISLALMIRHCASQTRGQPAGLQKMLLFSRRIARFLFLGFWYCAVIFALVTLVVSFGKA